MVKRILYCYRETQSIYIYVCLKLHLNVIHSSFVLLIDSSDSSLNNQNMNSEETSIKVDKDASATKSAEENLMKTDAQSNAPNDCNLTKTNTEINVSSDKDDSLDEKDLDVDRRSRLFHSGPISFSSGNHFVEVTKGLLHLYKEK